jgi:hypothetical protein
MPLTVQGRQASVRAVAWTDAGVENWAAWLGAAGLAKVARLAHSKYLRKQAGAAMPVCWPFAVVLRPLVLRPKIVAVTYHEGCSHVAREVALSFKGEMVGI